MRTVEKIEIKGFKSIESAEIELGDLNILIGANGSGKSNLIGAFRLLERYASDRLKEHVGTQPDHFLHHGSKVTPEMSLKLTSKGQTYGLALMAGRNELVPVNEQPPPNNKGAAGAARTSSKGPKKSLGDLAGGFVVYHFDDVSDLSPAKKFADLYDNRCLRHDAANLPAFLYWMQEREPTRFRRVQEHLRLAAPFFERIELAPSKINQNRIELLWRQKDSDAVFDAHSLSDGTLRLICLITLLEQPEPPDLILLDEPELGLHPFAIGMLAEMLAAASKRSQVIVATQSVTLLDNFEPERVVVVENDGRKSTFTRLEPDKLAAWLKNHSLGELWEKNVLGGGP
jgi:predicted ATPase